MAGESSVTILISVLFFWIYTIKRHQGTLKYSVIYKIITHEHISARKLRSYEDIRREKWIFFDNFSTVSENITYGPGEGDYSPTIRRTIRLGASKRRMLIPAAVAAPICDTLSNHIICF